MRRPQSAKVQPLSAGKTKDTLSGQKYKQLDKKDNHHPKAKTIQIKVQQNKQENSDENQLINSQLFQRKRSEHLNLISSFQHKMKLQQNEIEVLKQQVMLQQRCLNSVSYQQQPDLKQYEDEILRLRSLLDEALLMPSEPKRNQLITYLAKIQELKNELQKFKQVTDNQQRDIQQLQNTIKKQQDYLQNHEQSKSGRKQYEGQVDSNQFENQFNQQMVEKERKIAELTASMNKASKNFQTKINSQTQFIEQLNAQIQAKQNVIKQLEDENENLKSEIGYLEDQQKDSQTMIEQLQQAVKENNNPIPKSLAISPVQLLFEYQKKVKQLVVAVQVTQTVQGILSMEKLQSQFFYFNKLKNDSSSQYEEQSHIYIKPIDENIQKDFQYQEKQLEQDDVLSHTLKQVQVQAPEKKQSFSEEKETRIESHLDTDQTIKEIIDSYLQDFVETFKYEIDNEEETKLIAIEITQDYLNNFVHKNQNDKDLQVSIIQEIVDQYFDDILATYS